ncbi:MAG: GTP cyclohydrolase I [Gammaproteobacteria bacterium]|nr:GTP cyclohydrolase I [Gammaproteobacteria bacterium]
MENLKISDKIRTRIKEENLKRMDGLVDEKTYYANDNISEFIHPGEMELLVEEVEGRVLDLLKSLVIDVENDPNSSGTARRVAKMYLHEVFQGRYYPRPTATTFPNSKNTNGLQIIGPMTVRSACSHHLCPVLGKLWIGIKVHPGNALLGLSKFLRLSQWILTRPQIQEDAVVMLADTFSQTLKSEHIAIVMQTQHFCKTWRGVKDEHSLMISTEYRGDFLMDAQLRQELLNLIHYRSLPTHL